MNVLSLNFNLVGCHLKIKAFEPLRTFQKKRITAQIFIAIGYYLQKIAANSQCGKKMSGGWPEYRRPKKSAPAQAVVPTGVGIALEPPKNCASRFWKK